ncbi:MAG: CHAP domain-containing protein [Ruminococcaceae bacterium]|nr:CHAP domain-containing protein [Oscillospiraceae bacterium]
MQKKLMLRALSLVLALALCFSTISISASATQTVNGADAICNTAISQVGTYESGGYTKYGAYFGSPYVAWCCAFVSWCARTSGISESVIPSNLSCTAMRDAFIQKGLYHLAPQWGGSYTPKKGDLVFFTSTNAYQRSTNNITHIGIVLGATSSYVTCIEGNCPDRVRQLNRSHTNYIVGYATPAYEGVELGDTVTPESPYKAGTYKTNEIMNFRNVPGGTVYFTIPKDTTLEITAIQGVWGKTSYNGYEGWISLEYSTYIEVSEENEETETPSVPSTPSTPSTPSDGKKQYRVTETMNMRSSASTSGSFVGSVPEGTLIQVDEVTDDNWGKVTYQGVTGWISLNWSVEFAPEVDWLVMDISQWNAPSELNWTKLKAEGVKGVIIRIGGRGSSGEKSIYADDSFLQHYKAAKAAGMHVGVYFFSYALSKAEAIAEAQYTVDTLKKNNCVLDLPVYIDMEDLPGDTQHITAGKTVCSMVIDEFCKTVENAGYYAGIYTNLDFARNLINHDLFEGRSAWIAQWGPDVCTFNGRVDMWQYTENGKLDGAACDLDLNRMYIDYPALINNDKLENGLIEKGDVDCDGTVSAGDARLALRNAVSLEKFTALQKKIADMDSDGDITAADARLILKTSIGT